jgi:endonuclease YncB( thermonuclease family)
MRSMGNCYATATLQKNFIPEVIDVKSLPKYIPQISEGRVVSVYDGDTIHIAGFVINNPQLFKFSVRLNGIDCPEMKSGKSLDKTEHAVAVMAKSFLSEMNNKIVTLRNVDLDKYGRLLADVYFQERHLNKEMIDKRFAVKYDGRTKVVPSCWETYHKTGEMSH